MHLVEARGRVTKESSRLRKFVLRSVAGLHTHLLRVQSTTSSGPAPPWSRGFSLGGTGMGGLIVMKYYHPVAP